MSADGCPVDGQIGLCRSGQTPAGTTYSVTSGPQSAAGRCRGPPTTTLNRDRARQHRTAEWRLGRQPTNASSAPSYAQQADTSIPAGWAVQEELSGVAMPFDRAIDGSHPGGPARNGRDAQCVLRIREGAEVSLNGLPLRETTRRQLATPFAPCCQSCVRVFNELNHDRHPNMIAIDIPGRTWNEAGALPVTCRQGLSRQPDYPPRARLPLLQLTTTPPDSNLHVRDTAAALVDAGEAAGDPRRPIVLRRLTPERPVRSTQ